MARYECPIPLPDEHMRLVGIISAQWEVIELTMEQAIAEISEHEFIRIAVLTTNIGFQSKSDLILMYARPFQDTDPQTWKAFTKNMDRLRAAYAERNKYVHAVWEPGQDGEPPVRASVRTSGGKLSIISEPVPIEALNAAAQQIWNAGELFRKLLQSFGLLES